MSCIPVPVCQTRRKRSHDICVAKLMDQVPSILPAPSEGPSSAPTAPTDSQAMTVLSPPPATPSATQDTPVDIPNKIRLPSSSSVIKELFTAFVEEENTPDSKRQKIE